MSQIIKSNAGSGPTSPDLHAARFIVSAGGSADGANYTTIATGYAAAVSAGAPQTVFIQPGTYTEDITMSAGINLSAFSGDGYSPAVKIIGKLTASYSGLCTIAGIQLQTNGDYGIVVSGASSTQLYIKDCMISAANHTFLDMTSTGGGSAQFQDCFGNTVTTGIAYFNQTNGLIRLINCFFLNDGATSTASTMAGGTLTIYDSNFGNGVTATSTSNVAVYGSSIGQEISLNNTGGNSIFRSDIQGGTAPALTIGSGATVICTDMTASSSNTNAIAGAGTLNCTPISFAGSSSTIQGTLTVNSLPFLPSSGGGGVTDVSGDSGPSISGSVQFSAFLSGTPQFVSSTGAMFLNLGDGNGNLVLWANVGPALLSGEGNVVIGTNGFAPTSGNENIWIGPSAGTGADPTDSFNIYINDPGVSGDNGVARFDNIHGVTVTGSPVLVSSTNQLGVAASSQRFKKNIAKMPSTTAQIMALRPVTFNWNDQGPKDRTEETQYGLIAEEVEKVFPYLCSYDKEGKPFSVKYHELPAILLNEVQRLNDRVKALEDRMGRPNT